MVEADPADGGAGLTSHAARVRRLRRITEALAFLTVIAALVGMFVSTPRMAGPDEPAHQSTAWYVTNKGLPPINETYAPVPGNVSGNVCFAFDAANDASCLTGRVPRGGVEGRIFNYPPLYYWFVGFGQWVANSVGPEWQDVGGRAGSFALNSLALLALALLSRRQSRIWGSSILVISTPMAVFLWAVVNSSGWQIASGLLFSYVFAHVWWGSHRDLLLSRHQWRTLTAVTVTSVLFALSRPDSLIWLVLLALAVVLMARSPLQSRARLKVLMSAGVGVASGVMWQVSHPSRHPIENPAPLADPAFSDYVRWFKLSLDLLPDRIHQAIGVLGWLDTPTPRWLFLLTVIAWAAFLGYLYARNRIPIPVIFLGIASTLVFPSVLEALRWNDYPAWWQGRYTLPFLIPFLFLIVNRFASTIPRAVEKFSLISTAVLAFMVWQNGVRYAFGVREYWPVDWAEPAIGALLFSLSMGSSLMVMVFGVTRAAIIHLQFRRRVPSELSQ